MGVRCANTTCSITSHLHKTIYPNNMEQIRRSHRNNNENQGSTVGQTTAKLAHNITPEWQKWRTRTGKTRGKTRHAARYNSYIQNKKHDVWRMPEAIRGMWRAGVSVHVHTSERHMAQRVVSLVVLWFPTGYWRGDLC